MSKEYFDIVDENNIPTGEVKSREEVHREKKDWHRATQIWIINDQGQVLCQQRSWKKDGNPGMWQSFFGGHVKAGQTYEENLREELKEELGIVIAEHSEPIFIGIRKWEQSKHFWATYVLRWNGVLNDLAFNDGEVEQVSWMSLGELASKIGEGVFCNKIYEWVPEYIQTGKINRPSVIIVSGLPGTGKTSLAKKLSDELKIPYFARDEFKELLFDSLGIKDREWSRQLGATAYDLLFLSLRKELMSWRSVIIESNFWERAGKNLLKLQNEFSFQSVQIICRTDQSVRKERFRLRWESGERHRGHVDNENLHTEIIWDGDQPLPVVGPLMEIDTGDFTQISYPHIATKVREHLYI